MFRSTLPILKLVRLPKAPTTVRTMIPKLISKSISLILLVTAFTDILPILKNIKGFNTLCKMYPLVVEHYVILDQLELLPYLDFSQLKKNQKLEKRFVTQVKLLIIMFILYFNHISIFSICFLSRKFL